MERRFIPKLQQSDLIKKNVKDTNAIVFLDVRLALKISKIIL